MDLPIAADSLARSGGDAARTGEAARAFFVKRAMASEPIGIIASEDNGSRLARPRSPARGRLKGFASAALLVMVGGSVARFGQAPVGTAAMSSIQAAAAAAPVINLPPPDLLRPLSPQEATKENAERPFVKRADGPASRFVLRVGPDDRERALNCLTQAVYYEAASEGVDGGRAVAQVVLNRMRHPGYPASICGVVYQGSDRPIGCQFTFTCDGSLLRSPVESLWTRSRRIAEQALAGRVFAPIGHATSYHADYVLPYWADSLDKTIQIGRHIFYRLRGAYGDGSSFFQHYAGAEPLLPNPRAAVAVPGLSAAAQLAGALIANNIDGVPDDVEKAARPATQLAIDSSHGTLIGEAADPPPVPPRRQASSDCAAVGEGKQLAPLSATNMRSDAATSGC